MFACPACADAGVLLDLTYETRCCDHVSAEDLAIEEMTERLGAMEVNFESMPRDDRVMEEMTQRFGAVNVNVEAVTWMHTFVCGHITMTDEVKCGRTCGTNCPSNGLDEVSDELKCDQCEWESKKLPEHFRAMEM